MAERVESSIEVAAPPAEVWAQISDVSAMARWHPAIDTTPEWVQGGDEPRPGDRFRVSNVDARFDWSVDECAVVTFDPPRNFSFAVVRGSRDLALWSWELEPVSDGRTKVTAIHETRHLNLLERLRRRLGLALPDPLRGLEAALRGLKKAVEGTSA